MHRVTSLTLAALLVSSAALADKAGRSARVSHRTTRTQHIEPASIISTDQGTGVIAFVGNTTKLTSSAQAALQRIAAAQKNRPGTLLIVEGYAARVGSRSQALRLSERRNDVVRDALIEGGIDRSRLVLVAHGSEHANDKGSGPAQRVVVRPATGFGDVPRIASDEARPTAPTNTSGAGGPATIVVVPGSPPRTSSSRALPPSGTHPSNSGYPGRTSGGLGTSAVTGIGIDPTDGADYPASGGGGAASVATGDTDTSAPVRSGGVAEGAGTAYPGGTGATGARAGTSGAVGAGVTGSGIGPTGTGTGPNTASAQGNATGAGTGVANGTSSGTATTGGR